MGKQLRHLKVMAAVPMLLLIAAATPAPIATAFAAEPSSPAAAAATAATAAAAVLDNGLSSSAPGGTTRGLDHRVPDEGGTGTWRDWRLPLHQRVDDLISRLTLEEKVSHVSTWQAPIERLGMPWYGWWGECNHGAREEDWAEPGFTVWPQTLAVAAAFNTDLVAEMARLTSDELRAKSNDWLRRYGQHRCVDAAYAEVCMCACAWVGARGEQRLVWARACGGARWLGL